MNSESSKQLSEFRAIDTPITLGATLIEASAGTGKTFNIAHTVLRLLLETNEQGDPVVRQIGAILVVTFTKAATEELVSRIRQKLRIAELVWSGAFDAESTGEIEALRDMANGREEWAVSRVRGAIAELDTLSVFTIHAFCHKLLSRFALESGTAFGVSLVEDQKGITEEAMNDWWRRTFYLDSELANWLVAQDKTVAPESYLPSYNLWRRWSGTKIDPDVNILTARGEVVSAGQEFLSQLNKQPAGSTSIIQFFESIPWKKGKEIDSGVIREGLIPQFREMADGSLAAAQSIANHLAKSVLLEQVNRGTTAGKRKAAEVEDWPIAIAAEKILLSLKTLKQAILADCLKFTYKRVTQFKENRNQVGFDDVLERVHSVLLSQGSHGLLAKTVREEFQAALIDEFQDTDSLQFDIFRNLFAGCPLFLIGDPKQSIYAFRGADLRAYIAAAQTAEQRYTLSGNYRSSPAMVSAVNALFSNAVLPFVEEEVGYFDSVAMSYPAPEYALEGSHALEWLFVEPEQGSRGPKNTTVETAQSIVFDRCVEIIQQHIADKWEPRRIAVLVRRLKEGEEIARRLTEVGIPTVLSRQGDVMQSAEASEFLCILAAIADPHSSSAVRAAATTRIWGADYSEIRQTTDSEYNSAWALLQGQFANLHEVWASFGPLQCIERLLHMRDVVPRLLRYKGGRRRVTNVRHLQELLHDLSDAGSLGVKETIQAFITKRSVSAEGGDTRELKLDTDDEAVQITTIHGSKGLEYDIVLCPTLWWNRPNRNEEALLVHDGAQAIFDHGSVDYPTRALLAERDRLAEDCRLVYVALTRAVHRTYVAWGPIGTRRPSSADSGLTWLLCGGKEGAVENIASNPGAWEPLLKAIIDKYPSLMKYTDASRMRSVSGNYNIQPIVSDILAARQLPAYPPPSERFSTFSVASFTSLSAGKGHAVSDIAASDIAADDELLGDKRLQILNIEALPNDLSDFRTFPAGASAGLALHSLLERVAFDASDSELFDGIPPLLTQLSIENSEHEQRTQAVMGMLQNLLRNPVTSWGFPLSSIVRSKTRREWQFLISMAQASSRLTRDRLSKVFAKHGGDFGASYSEQLLRLSFRNMFGFLTGFVDLLFEHNGRWYIVDWKSNQLGADTAAYQTESLKAAMNENHYTLQYHLYTLAVHRYLKQRIPDYSYETHFGGVGYAFLRGFESALPNTSGWFVDRPSLGLVEALDALFSGKSDSGSV